MKVKYRSNLWAGIMSMICGIILTALIPTQIGTEYSSNYGITSKSVPYAVAAIFLLCGLALTVQSLVFKKDKVKELEVKKELKALIYMAVFACYTYLFDKSFLISSVFLGVATLMLCKSKNKLYYGIVVVTVLILYVIFTQALHVRLK